MESDKLQSFEGVPSDDDTVQMTTLYSTSTAWTQATVWVEFGKVQLPEITEYSFLQPIEMASYPDPIMSATGANLQYLLGQKHAKASMSSMSDVGDSTAAVTDTLERTMVNEEGSSTIGITVVPVTYTTEYLTTTLITIYPTDSLLETPNAKLQSSTSVVPISTASTEIPTMNTVVPITVEQPISSVESDLLGRDEPLRDIVSLVFKSKLFHDDIHIDQPSVFTSRNNIAILIYIVIAILLTFFIIHLFLVFRDRRDSTDLFYTTKPPRPGLRKRMSLSMSMTPGRRSSIASTSSTEATYVSGNAVSIGKAGGKGLGFGNQESEVRRTPSTPLLEV